MIKDIYNKAKKFIGVILREDIFGSAAEMSYMLTLSVFPLLLSFMAIFSIVGNTAQVGRLDRDDGIIGHLSVQRRLRGVAAGGGNQQNKK